MKEWLETHQDEHLAKSKIYYETHRDEVSARRRASNNMLCLYEGEN